VFRDKAVLDCSEIVLSFSLFLDDMIIREKSHSSTADSTPVGSFIIQENFTLLTNRGQFINEE
jgi:hypothetical protein